MSRPDFFSRKLPLLAAFACLLFFEKKVAAIGCASPVFWGRPPCNFALSFQVLSNFNGFAVSCSDSRDGSVAMAPSMGAVAPVEVYWSSGEIGATAQQLAGGWAHVSVTDATGCRVEDSVFLKKPGQLIPGFEVFGEKCLGTADGLVEVNSVAGGVAPVNFSINGLPGELTPGAIGPLPAGTFFMETADANGCRDTFGFVVPSGLPFDFEIGADTANIFSGDTFLLKKAKPAGVDTIIWQPSAPVAPGFSGTAFFPKTTTKFTATAVNALGCESTDELLVLVKTARDFFAPNIIWRSAGEEANQFFTLYTSGGVVEIERLEVFDRWGNLVFRRKNFEPGLPSLGWDGTFRGKRATGGVHVFHAIVRQTDGKAKLYSGDFLLAD